VSATPSLTVVAPLRLTVPVPVAKAPPPEIVVSPLSVTAPELVAKAPLLVAASNAPPSSLMPLSTVSVGRCELGK